MSKHIEITVILAASVPDETENIEAIHLDLDTDAISIQIDGAPVKGSGVMDYETTSVVHVTK